MNIPNDPKWISKRKTWKSETEARLDCWGGKKKKQKKKKRLTFLFLHLDNALNFPGSFENHHHHSLPLLHTKINGKGIYLPSWPQNVKAETRVGTWLTHNNLARSFHLGHFSTYYSKNKLYNRAHSCVAWSTCENEAFMKSLCALKIW